MSQRNRPREYDHVKLCIKMGLFDHIQLNQQNQWVYLLSVDRFEPSAYDHVESKTLEQVLVTHSVIIIMMGEYDCISFPFSDERHQSCTM